ncbi:MAG: PilZ domain-containing protein [Candidatus Aminicenantales bacterium]|jgi:hypothetical protein
MDDESLEKRICVRFRIPDAEIRYKKEKFFIKRTDFIDEPLPMLDMSRGGIRFFSRELLKFDSIVTVKITVLEEKEPLILRGTVRWYMMNSDPTYKYQLGVQFLPYGEKKDQNSSQTLARIITLEQKYMDETMIPENPPESF